MTKKITLQKKIAMAVLLSAAIGVSWAQTDLKQLRNTQEAKLKTDNQLSGFSYNEDLQTLKTIAFKPYPGFVTSGAKALIKNYYSLTNANDDVRQEEETTTPYGITITMYRQYYNGIKLEHGTYKVMSKNNMIQSISAESYAVSALNTPTVPVLTERQALQKTLDFTRAEVYGWEALKMDIDKATDGNLKAKLTSELQKILPKGELLYSKDVYGDGQSHLAYKFDITTQKPIGKFLIYIDAITGNVLLRDVIIKHYGEINDHNKQNLAYQNAYRGFTSAGNANTVPLPDPSLIIQPQPTGANGANPTGRVTSSVIASAKTRYAGVRSIYTTRVTVPYNEPNNTSVSLTYSGVDPRIPVLSGSVYVLDDDTRGKGISTYDLNAVGGAPVSLPGIYSSALSFVDIDNVWKDETAVGTNEDLMRGATQPPSTSGDAGEALNDDIAIDAHWGAGVVYDYWTAIHGRKSYDNHDATINSYVHYGAAYDNAFWNGSVMTYGDGQGFRPLVSLDVCGHEIGHGVCSNTANLVYAGESGGMNEALSDIWASCIENFALNTVDNTLPYYPFQIGEQIDYSSPNIGLRRMDNPKAFTNPDSYAGQYWTTVTGCTPTLANDECGVHNNSGVLNKWFYLLVKGPKATTGAPLLY